VLLGFLYFLATLLLTGRAPSGTAQVHTAIGSAFLVLAVPIGLEARWITLGWLLESVVLIEVSERARNRSLNVIGSIALALGVARVIAVDTYSVQTLVLNERMLTSAIAVAALAFAARKWAASETPTERQSVPVLVVAINAVALIGLNREITDAFQGIVRDFAYSALWMAYGVGLMLVGFWKTSRFLRWQALILIFVTILKVFFYDTSSLDVGYRILSFIALGLVLLVTSFLYQRNWFKAES